MDALDAVALATLGVGLTLAWAGVAVLAVLALIGAGEGTPVRRWYRGDGLLPEVAHYALVAPGVLIFSWVGKVAGVPGCLPD